MSTPLLITRSPLMPIWRGLSAWWRARTAAPRQTVRAHTLPEGRAFRFHLLRGEAVLVREGRLWLTREGDLHDHVLAPGAGFVATRTEEVVVEAFGGGACRIERHRVDGLAMAA